MKSFYSIPNIRLILFTFLVAVTLFILFGFNSAKAAPCSPITSVNTTISASCVDLLISGASGTLTINSGVTVGTASSHGFPISGDGSTSQFTITGITNNGIVGAANAYDGLQLLDLNVTGRIINNGQFFSTNVNAGMDLDGAVFTSTIGGITNNVGGIISGASRGIVVNNGLTVGDITNYGTISATTTPGYSGGILVFGTVGTINNNSGSITGVDAGIYNGGTVGTLNNAQGGDSSNASRTALTYTGPLPSAYNIIINSSNNYGQLRVATLGVTGTTNFGISSLSAGSSVVSSSAYTSVFNGLTPTMLGISGTSKSGVSNGYGYTLTENGTNIWDLVITSYSGTLPSTPIGPSVANTNQSLVNTASVLQGTYTLQNSVLANSFSYDCTVFGANDVCVSAGGRNTQVQAANGLNNTSALLIAAYRPHLNYRIGAYADQNLSVSNPGGTVNLGNNTPLIGLFAAWNERLDGTGTEVKVSAAYGQKNTTINRSVVGSGTGASEAGSGSSTLNSQGTQATAKYGFGILDNVIVSPYVGVRYTQNNMAGYTEGSTSSVTAPLTYSALNTNATTALAGVGASYRVIPQVMTFASAGVETDTNTANGTYSATNTSIGTLTPVNFNANPVRTRPTATVGAYYDIEKNQRVGITGIYRQEAYQAVSTTTVLATYTIGL